AMWAHGRCPPACWPPGSPPDLPALSPGYGPLPSVVGTTDRTGGWHDVGQTSTALPSDGRRGRAEVAGDGRPRASRPTVSGRTGLPGWLTQQAHGGGGRLSDTAFRV